MLTDGHILAMHAFNCKQICLDKSSNNIIEGHLVVRELQDMMPVKFFEFFDALLRICN